MTVLALHNTWVHLDVDGATIAFPVGEDPNHPSMAVLLRCHPKSEQTLEEFTGSFMKQRVRTGLVELTPEVFTGRPAVTSTWTDGTRLIETIVIEAESSFDEVSYCIRPERFSSKVGVRAAFAPFVSVGS